MNAQGFLRFTWRRGTAAIGLLAISSTFWVVTHARDKPSYGGRPSKTLEFTLPKDDRPAAAKAAFDNAARSNPVVIRESSNASAGGMSASSLASSANVFVNAIVSDDTNAAFGLLTKADRDFFGSVAQFGATLARSAPWLHADVTTTETSIVATVQRTPQLDDALGLIAATAKITMLARNESGAWRVDWRHRTISEESTLNDVQAKDDVARWAYGHQACKPDVRLEHPTGIAGVSGFAAALCRTKAPISVDDVTSLESLDDPGPFVDAFGPEVMHWGRVVTLRAPIDMRVVVAPVGDRWIVVGLSRPETVIEAPSS
jgi:hypothetical protein